MKLLRLTPESQAKDGDDCERPVWIIAAHVESISIREDLQTQVHMISGRVINVANGAADIAAELESDG